MDVFQRLRVSIPRFWIKIEWTAGKSWNAKSVDSGFWEPTRASFFSHANLGYLFRALYIDEIFCWIRKKWEYYYFYEPILVAPQMVIPQMVIFGCRLNGFFATLAKRSKLTMFPSDHLPHLFLFSLLVFYGLHKGFGANFGTSVSAEILI